MEVKIEPATIEDLKKIQELNLMLFKKEYKYFDSTLDCNWTYSDVGENYFKERILEADGCVFVAIANNEVVGYLAGAIMDVETYRTLQNCAELENMFVLEKNRGMGIGKKLYQALVGWCKSKGIGRLRVGASAKNLDGISFYRKNGFRDYDLILEADL